MRTLVSELQELGAVVTEKLARPALFCRRAAIEQIDKDVRVEEDFHLS